VNQPDAVVGTYLKYFTFMPVVEINALMEMHKRNPERRVGQKKLAEEVTALVHGAAAAAQAEKFTDVLFGASSFGQLLTGERDALFAAVPSVTLMRGASIVDALTEKEFVSSKSEVRRLMEAKGIRLNGEAITADRPLEDTDLRDGLAVLQKGKSEKLLVRFK